MKKKRLNLKYKTFDNILMSSDMFKTLKKFREKKQVSIWSNANSFDFCTPQMINESIVNNFYREQSYIKDKNEGFSFDSEDYNLDNLLVFIKLDHYINSIILYSFINNLYYGLRADKVLTDQVKNSIWANIKTKFDIYTPSIKHRLTQNFFKVYAMSHYGTLQNLSQFVVKRSRVNRIFKKIYLDTVKGFQSVLDYLQWDIVEKNKIYQCSLTGLFHRFGDVQSFYRDISINNLNSVIDRININLFGTNVNELFVSNYFARGQVYLGYENPRDDSGQAVYCKYISSKKTIVFNIDEKTQKENPSVNLTSNNNQLRNYSFKVIDGLPFAQMPYEKDQNKNLYLGVELEVNKSSRAPRQIVKMLEEKILSGTAICKSDGSLGHKGLELNIVPMTLDYAKQTNYWFNFEKNVKDYLYSYRDKKTGVHVHVPRHLFTKYQIGLIGQFLNLKANYDYLVGISGRDMNKDTSYCVANPEMTIKNFKYETDRYSVLNTIPEKTIEFRLFKGNISANTIYRYLEFVHALCTYARSHSMNSKTHHNEFIKWVETNSFDYPILNRFHFKDTNKVFRKVESFKVQYNRRFRNISFNVPTLKLAEPLRFRRVRAIRTRDIPSSLNQPTNREVNNHDTNN
jgi:hypothetical protein